jgi:hypothetical protein
MNGLAGVASVEVFLGCAFCDGYGGEGGGEVDRKPVSGTSQNEVEEKITSDGLRG